MANLVKSPYPLFTDIDGSPLDNGYITISPLQAYWDKELTLPANNIRTKGGYPDNGGVTGQLYTEDTDYTITVRNKKNFVVYASSEAYDRNLFQAGIAYSPNRIAFQELTSGTLSTSGWYTIAETDAISNVLALCDILIAVSGSARIGTLAIRVASTGSGNAKTKDNLTVEYLPGFSSFAEGQFYLPPVRVAKSDTVAGSGFKIQIFLDISSTVMTWTQIRNIGRFSENGFSLVSPTQTNNTFLPDGVTAATFIEAGAELSLGNSGEHPGFKVKKLDANILACMADFGQIPMQGTTVTLTTPSDIQVKDGAAVSVALTGFTLSSPTYYGNIVYFTLTQASAFASINAGPLVALIVGTGSKITLS